jgi:hypothetical protein
MGKTFEIRDWMKNAIYVFFKKTVRIDSFKSQPLDYLSMILRILKSYGPNLFVDVDNPMGKTFATDCIRIY